MLNEKRCLVRHKNVSCGAVTWRIKEERLEILLIKQVKGNCDWGLPKGRLKEDETFEECARREVFEETGVVINLEKQLVGINFGAKKYVFFVAEPVGNCVINKQHPDNETADAQWVDISTKPSLTYHSQLALFRAFDVMQENEEIAKVWFYQAMNHIYSFAPGIRNWLRMRIELKKVVGKKLMSHLSIIKREKITPNDFEKDLIKRWEQMTNEEVVVQH